MSYTIREVDAADDEIAEIIHDFNRAAEPTFPNLKEHELEGVNCYWWLAYHEGEPVAFSGLVPSRLYKNAGYLKRSGVVPEHRGNGLQLRFFRVREAKARKVGWEMIVSETTETVYSANNFIRAGYQLFEPSERWAFNHSLYWRKFL